MVTRGHESAGAPHLGSNQGIWCKGSGGRDDPGSCPTIAVCGTVWTKKATSPDQMASSSSTSRVMMRINHQNFQLANVQARLNRLSPTDRYREQRVVAEQLLQLQDVIDDTIERYYQYVKKDEAWKVVTTKAAFETDFAAVKQVAKTRKQNRLEY